MPHARPPADARVARAFAILVGAVTVFGPLAFGQVWAHGGDRAAALPALVVSVLALGLFVRLAGRLASTRLRVSLAVVLAAAVPTFYGATGAWIAALDPPLHDAALRSVDAALVGWLFPDGQMSIWIDRATVIGPREPLGHVLTEFFQLGYTSYYVWGYGLLALLLWRAARRRTEASWTHARMFLCAWVGAYLLNYLAYVFVPAMGPWFAYPDAYLHELEGLLLTPAIRTAIATNQVVPDCFPSGHVALSWIPAICALRFAPRYGRWALAGAVVITLATVGLRYHYFVDVLAAVPLVVLGLYAGGMLRGGRSVPFAVAAVRDREATP